MRLNIIHCTLWECQYICMVIFYNVDVIRLVGRKLLWSWDKHKLWLSLSYLVLRNKILLCHWPTRKQWVLNLSVELTNTCFFSNMHTQVCTILLLCCWLNLWRRLVCEIFSRGRCLLISLVRGVLGVYYEG